MPPRPDTKYWLEDVNNWPTSQHTQRGSKPAEYSVVFTIASYYHVILHVMIKCKFLQRTINKTMALGHCKLHVGRLWETRNYIGMALESLTEIS